MSKYAEIGEKKIYVYQEFQIKGCFKSCLLGTWMCYRGFILRYFFIFRMYFLS